MANLSALLGSKSEVDFLSESNIEDGKIWAYSPNNGATLYGGTCAARWCATATGYAVIEMWGSGGTAAIACCCGRGLPGNTGAYIKKCLPIVAGDLITGTPGMACNQALQCAGCGSPTVLCYVTAGSTGCICVEGGRSGNTYCETGTSTFDCFNTLGHCVTSCGTLIGYVCNFQAGQEQQAYESNGDFAACSQSLISCMYVGCAGFNPCYNRYYHPVPPGIISTAGSYLVYPGQCQDGYSVSNGDYFMGFSAALNAAHRQPGPITHWKPGCWASTGLCACYEAHSCQSLFPVGTGGTPTMIDAGQANRGKRGGHGAIRIKFVET